LFLKRQNQIKLYCTLPVLAHKKLGNMHYLHQIFNKFRSIFKHNDNLQVGYSSKSNVCSDI